MNTPAQPSTRIIGVDVGGTFTDVVACRDGVIETVKVPTQKTRAEQAVLAGAREIGVEDTALFNHASTHGLNAVITRTIPKIGFITTEGHRDILDIGRSWRPVEGLTDASWRRPFGDASRPLVPRYLRRGVVERVTATGEELIPLDEQNLRRHLEVLRRCEVSAVAICFLNAYVDGSHERRAREIVVEVLGDIPVSVSSEVSPLAKEFARASTTVIDVLMKLTYQEYTTELDRGLRDLGFAGGLHFADCVTQLIPAKVAMEHPFNIVYSGPSGGTTSSAYLGTKLGVGNLLCCDVGGTSTDISVVTDGAPYVNTTFELEPDLIVNSLSNEVTAIGAGGGSLVTISPVGELKVGPGSAGADPGPAAYGAGGTQPTMTDACLLAGILDPAGFAGGRMALDADAAARAFESLDTSLSLGERVRTAFNVGVNNVADGLMNVAIKRGIDPSDYSLIAYGAAGPMLLPGVLDIVNVREIIIPPHPGLFSALGLVSTDLVYSDSRSAYTVLTADAAERIDAVFSSMEDDLRAQFDPSEVDQVEFERTFDARLLGQSWETPFIAVPAGRIDAAAVDTMIANFHAAYRLRYGNTFEALPVQGVTYRVNARRSLPKVDYQTIPSRDGGAPTATSETRLRYLFGEELAMAEYQRDDLRAGDVIEGPAVIREAMSTTFVGPNQRAAVGTYGEIHITKAGDGR